MASRGYYLACAANAAGCTPGFKERVVGDLGAAKGGSAEKSVEVAGLETGVFGWFGAVLMAALLGLGGAHIEFAAVI